MLLSAVNISIVFLIIWEDLQPCLCTKYGSDLVSVEEPISINIILFNVMFLRNTLALIKDYL